MKNVYAMAEDNINVVNPVTEPGDLNNPPGTGADEADFEEDEDEDADDDDDNEEEDDEEDDVTV